MLTVGRPLDGMDIRELCALRVWPFLSRVLIYTGLVAGLVTTIVSTSGLLWITAVVVLGLVYAHGVELQHQALHNAAFPSKAWNRIVGFLLGLPALVSYSDYQYSHMRHHRLLGTPEDREFFNYGYERLTSIRPLLAHLFMVRHYRDVAGFIVRSVMGKTKPGVREEAARKIRLEYQLMAICIAAAISLSIALRTTLFLEVWLLPMLVAIPTHALIELPEHWGQEHASTDVLHNTRTIGAGRFAVWFTNGNNYHVEHHWLPSVPNHRFPELHARIEGTFEPTSGYWRFYRQFFGELYRNTFARRPSESAGDAS